LRFYRKITNGGILVYNENDSEVKRVAEAQLTIRKLPQHTQLWVENGYFARNSEGYAY
jgi:UDP-N-acetylmuramate: L-alanyl-gamma-D-glutamyl-meso-diaminopimelate ligase